MNQGLDRNKPHVASLTYLHVTHQGHVRSMDAVLLFGIILPFYVAAKIVGAFVKGLRAGRTPEGRERMAQMLIDYYERHPRAYNRKWKTVDAAILKLLR
jgi:hypothetical protein